MNPRKLKPGDRILWDEKVEEIVIVKDEYDFKTIDAWCVLHEYSCSGKILNCRKLKRHEYTIHLVDLVGEMEIHLIKKCREITEAIALLEKLL